MGIDNRTKLIFGIEIDYETVMKIMKSFFSDKKNQELFESNQIDLEEDEAEFFYRFFNEIDLFQEKYEGLCLVSACPYYDVGFENYTFYISILKCGDSSSLTMNETKTLIEAWKKTYNKIFKQCLEDYEIEYEDPQFLSVSHIY